MVFPITISHECKKCGHLWHRSISDHPPRMGQDYIKDRLRNLLCPKCKSMKVKHGKLFSGEDEPGNEAP